MSSIVTAVFKATISLLVNKGRDKAAEKLKDADVTDQKFRGLIIREIDHDIKSKLDGLSRRDLLASISFFKEGIELLYEVFDNARSTSEHSAATTQAACDKAFSLAKGMKKLELTGLDGSATRALSDAKERFKDARRTATDAFANEALETADRILALQYRVMATILEKLDNPADAVAPCRVCIEELHHLSAVQECFKLQLTRGFWARFGKDRERRKIIADVCHVNFLIYCTTLMVCFSNKELSNWPCVGSGEDKVNPLRDERVAIVLREQGMEHCCVPWSFGQEGKKEHKLKVPCEIATNSSGQFIVGDDVDRDVKVFDPSGKFIHHFSVPNDDVNTMLYILDVATDNQDNIYVLVQYGKKPGSERFVVYEFSNAAGLHHKFPVRGEYWGKLTVTNNRQVLVLKMRSSCVAVYYSDGKFVHTFGERTLEDACDITAANDGRVMVVEQISLADSLVHIFSENGVHLNQFKRQLCYSSFARIAFHRTSEHVVIVSHKLTQEKLANFPIKGRKDPARLWTGLLHVKIYTKDGEIVRSTQIHEERTFIIRGVTVTMEGRIAVVLQYVAIDRDYKVLVV